MKLISSLCLTASFLFGLASAQYPIEANVDAVNYTDPYDNDFPLMGYASIPEGEGPFPAVVIIPDWNNVDEYERVRATLIAEQFGWVGFAADIYGLDYQDGVPNFDDRVEQATLYRSNNTLFMGRMQAAVDLMRAHPAVDADNVAMIGYCFGGTGILTFSFLGGVGLKGAVSFHGGLAEFPVTTEVPHPVVVLSGGDDDTGTEVEFLETQLDNANATWQITRYSGIEHAFTVWTDDRYNERADNRSWREMETFLKEVFGEISYGTPEPDTTEVVAVDYDDGGFALTGYLSIPEGASMDEKLPAVVIVPDWDGVSGMDGYEAHRATLLASEGYVAFAADIYGSNLTQVEAFDQRIELAGSYRSEYELFVSRIQAAVDVVAAHELVDPEKILLIGYCFGGTGVVDYAFAGLENVKAVVPFHGGLTSLAPIQTDEIYPYVLIQSGGEDDAHGNNTELEMALDSANATWEISRYSNVYHGFTAWSSDAYNARADWRSWDAMLQVIDRVLEEPPTITDLATSTEDLSTLVDLVVLADLAETLAGPGPFTVFAPVNSAFAALDNATVSALAADPSGALTEVLLYHVVPGTILSTDLVDGATVATVGGPEITVSLDPVMINDASVVAADIMASNGVVHVIDKVLIPPATAEEEEEMQEEEEEEMQEEEEEEMEEEEEEETEPTSMETITDLAIATEDLSTLVDLVVLADLAETLAGPGPFTVFAPLNGAFEALDNATVSALTSDPAGALTDVLLYHVVSGTILSTDLVDGAIVPTVGGPEITVFLDPVMINDANVVMPDIRASNGVVHIIDKVLIPPTPAGEDLEEEDSFPVEESDEEEEEEQGAAVSRGDPDEPWH